MSPLEAMAVELEENLGLPLNEARVYLLLAENESLSAQEVGRKMQLDEGTLQATLDHLVSKGFTILQPGDSKRYVALHPRLALSNVFKIYQEQVIRQLRERRAAVDKLVYRMTPLFEGACTGSRMSRG